MVRQIEIWLDRQRYGQKDRDMDRYIYIYGQKDRDMNRQIYIWIERQRYEWEGRDMDRQIDKGTK